MEKQWGDNPEYTVSAWFDLSNWALPLGINWRYVDDILSNKCFNIQIMFLCFGFNFEIWRWNK